VRKDLRCQTGAWGPIEPQRIFGALSNRLRSRAVPSHDPTDLSEELAINIDKHKKQLLCVFCRQYRDVLDDGGNSLWNLDWARLSTRPDDDHNETIVPFKSGERKKSRIDYRECGLVDCNRVEAFADARIKSVNAQATARLGRLSDFSLDRLGARDRSPLILATSEDSSMVLPKVTAVGLMRRIQLK
jgi:hypothetical protein